MAEKKTDRQKKGGQRTQSPKKDGSIRRLALFALTLALVLLVMLAAAWRDSTGFDVLKRYLNYGAAGTGNVQYSFPASGKNRCAALGDSLAVLSDASLRLLDQNNQEVWSVSAAMSAPAVSQGGGRVAAYDVGGTELYVLDENGPILHLTADPEEPFISARLNRRGMLAVTTESKTSKGRVSVYNSQMELQFAVWSSERFILDAYATDDGTSLAAVMLGQEGGQFVSNIVLYDLSREDPAADYDVPDGLVLSIGQQNGLIASVSDTALTFATLGGSISASYAYGNSFLRDYELTGDGFAALLLNRYQSGNVGRLVTVDSAGKELGSLDVRAEIRDLSAAGRYLAVLYTDSLMVYNQELQVYASLRGVNASGVLMRSDGSALLLSADSASLFLP